MESLSIEDLTSRQIRILNLIAEGMTNAEISRQVLLSESSVRQETIKIYRALGVSGRREAMLRGRDLGLVPSIEDIQNEQLAPPQHDDRVLAFSNQLLLIKNVLQPLPRRKPLVQRH